MRFNISYDLIALIVLFVISIRFYSQKKYPVFSNKMYGLLLILGIANISFDILGTITIEKVSGIPLFVAYIPNILYYIAQLALSAALVLYEIAILGNKKAVRKLDYLLTLIPFAICLVIFAAGMACGQIFTISPEGDYERGSLSIVTFLCIGIYLALMFFLLFKERKVFSRQDHFSFMTLGCFIILTTSLQFAFPTELLSGSAIALAFLIMYFSIQDPQKMLDNDTGLFNVHAFLQLADHGNFLKTHDYIATFKLHGLHNIFSLKGREIGDATLRFVGNSLLQQKAGWSFRVADAVFTVCFKSRSELDDFIKDFELVRKAPFRFGNVEFVPVLTLILLDRSNGLTAGKDVLSAINAAFDKRNIKSLKNKTTFLTRAQTDAFLRGVCVENEIRQNLKDGKGFFMNYQPIYSLSNRRFVSAEALVRYKSETLGRLSPGEFVPLIEEKGMAAELDEIVVRKVFADIEAGAFRDLKLHNIHVNLSAATFSSEKNVDRIIELAKEHGIPGSKVVFEITETATTHSDELLEKCVAKLVKEGFGLALDDFGVGYANIARLYKLPFTAVKLDRCVITESARVFKQIAGIFESFDLDVVSEGVETAEQVETVRSAGVDLIQGFYFAKPLPPDQLVPFVKEKLTASEKA